MGRGLHVYIIILIPSLSTFLMITIVVSSLFYIFLPFVLSFGTISLL